MTPKFSIIIPIYNTEKYLKECVDSVLKQDFENYELILVDDGSTDNSVKICDEYAEQDKRVKVIHKPNGGLSDARNCGTRESIGEYIIFLDSDDFIHENSLSKISKTCEEKNADIIFLKGFKFFTDTRETQELDEDLNMDELKNKEEKLNYITSLKKFPGSACTKTFRREFILANELFFEKGLVSEDIEWMIRALKASKTIDYNNTPYYYYRQNRAGSITHTVKARNVNALIEIIKKHAIKNPNNKEDECINNFLAYEYIILLANNLSLSKEEKIKVTDNVYEYKWILQYDNNPKVKLVNKIRKICGIKITARLLKMYLKLR